MEGEGRSEVAAGQLLSAIRQYAFAEYGKCRARAGLARRSEAAATGVHGAERGDGAGGISVDAEREAGPEGIAGAGVRIGGEVSGATDAAGRDFVQFVCGGTGGRAGRAG